MHRWGCGMSFCVNVCTDGWHAVLCTLAKQRDGAWVSACACSCVHTAGMAELQCGLAPFLQVLNNHLGWRTAGPCGSSCFLPCADNYEGFQTHKEILPLKPLTSGSRADSGRQNQGSARSARAARRDKAAKVTCKPRTALRP